MRTAEYFVLQRGGTAWGLASGMVRSLDRRADGIAVATAAGTITADAVLEVATHLDVRPAGAVLRLYWPESCDGLAVHSGLPVVVVSPGALPRPLRQDEEEETPHAR